MTPRLAKEADDSPSGKGRHMPKKDAGTRKRKSVNAGRAVGEHVGTAENVRAEATIGLRSARKPA